MFNLYARIDALCKESKISVTTLCKDAGISRASLSDLKAGRSKGLSVETIKKISAHFGTPINFLLGEQPFRYWEELNSDRKTFFNCVGCDPDLLKQLWLIDPDFPEDAKLSDVLRYVDSIISDATPIGDTWAINYWDIPQKNQEVAAEAADLSEVKANFIESVKEMTDEQIMLLQAVVDQVLRENGMR